MTQCDRNFTDGINKIPAALLPRESCFIGDITDQHIVMRRKTGEVTRTGI